MPSNKVRTRFAPSPTGYMHVGNLRTALYTYLMAKHEDGTFILRIEDTDQGRYVEGAVDVIYNTLRETGLLWDEGPDIGGPVGPYVQSERMGMFKQYAEQLVAEGKAYYCFCTEERLEALHAEQRAHGEGGHDLAAAQPKPEAHDGEQRLHGEGPPAGAAGQSVGEQVGARALEPAPIEQRDQHRHEHAAQGRPQIVVLRDALGEARGAVDDLNVDGSHQGAGDGDHDALADNGP